MKNHLQLIKLLAAILLLVSFFLPMSSCSYTVPINEDATYPGAETRTSIMYASEYVDLDEIGSWLNILAFTWPFPVILLQWRFWGRKYSYLLTGSGILLSVFTAIVIYGWADIGKPLIGAYVGGGAAIVLFGSYTGELVQYFRKRNEDPSTSA